MDNISRQITVVTMIFEEIRKKVVSIALDKTAPKKHLGIGTGVFAKHLMN